MKNMQSVCTMLYIVSYYTFLQIFRHENQCYGMIATIVINIQ